MLSYSEYLKILKKTNALLEGHFILSSGLHSKQYVQCAKLLSFPKKAELICSSLCEKIKKSFNKIDVILAPAIGGIVIGYEVGRQLNIETIFAERQEGKLVLRRGFDISKNSNVLIVEDVITTGKSALECLNLIKQHQSNCIGYSCIIDRSNDSSLINFTNIGCRKNILEHASQLIGTTYLWGGKSGFGFDCSGLVQAVFNTNGISFPRDSRYQYEMVEKKNIKLEKAETGDLLFFEENDKICHVGIYDKDLKFIHCSGMVKYNSLDKEDELFDRKLMDKFVGVFSISEITFSNIVIGFPNSTFFIF